MALADFTCSAVALYSVIHAAIEGLQPALEPVKTFQKPKPTLHLFPSVSHPVISMERLGNGVVSFSFMNLPVQEERLLILLCSVWDQLRRFQC